MEGLLPAISKGQLNAVCHFRVDDVGLRKERGR